MNEIITKLDEIEKKANGMISDAKNRKEEMAAGLEKDKKAFCLWQVEKVSREEAGLPLQRPGDGPDAGLTSSNTTFTSRLWNRL